MDTGAVDPRVADALAAYADRPGGYAAALAALRDSRLVVPVVAVPGEVEVDAGGLAHDKSSEMATVLLTGRDGRLALLAFTGTEPLARWSGDARPVPVTARDAAGAAVAEGAAALVVDVAGPVPFVVEGDDLTTLSCGGLP
jgi:SseB protein N-terminal domain